MTTETETAVNPHSIEGFLLALQSPAAAKAWAEALMPTVAHAPRPRRTQSETLSKLALALAKAQGAMEGAAKDKFNPAFKGEGKPKGSSYADLASCWDAIRKPLADNELCVLQLTVATDTKFVSVETQLHHSSGEFITSVLTIPVSKPDAHGILGALTYARRGGLMAMVGIAAEDDDGNTASGVTPGAPPLHLRPRASSSAPISSAPPARDEKANVQADYGPDGAPISERAKLEVAITEAQDEAALQKLVERITTLPATDKAGLRKLWGARRDAVKAEGKPAEDPNVETMSEAERLAEVAENPIAGA